MASDICGFPMYLADQVQKSVIFDKNEVNPKIHNNTIPDPDPALCSNRL